MPYKMNADGSLTAVTPLNLGTNSAVVPAGSMVGDVNGKYLFVSRAKGSTGNYGINTYSIGANGTLTYSSGPVFSGQSFYALLLNSSNSLIYGNGLNLVTAFVNLNTGVLTPVSSVTDPCGNRGPLTLEPKENFIYAIDYPTSPSTLCGFSVNTTGTS